MLARRPSCRRARAVTSSRGCAASAAIVSRWSSRIVRQKNGGRRLSTTWSTRGAKGTDQEIDAAIRYLSRHFGRPAAESNTRPAPTSDPRTRPAVPVPSARGTAPAGSTPVEPQNEWRVYGQDPGGRRYSPLKQINAQNVAGLRTAWTYGTQEPSDAAPSVTPPPSSSRGTGAANAPGRRQRPPSPPSLTGDAARRRWRDVSHDSLRSCCRAGAGNRERDLEAHAQGRRQPGGAEPDLLGR